jgi:hypothetical protein
MEEFDKSTKIMKKIKLNFKKWKAQQSHKYSWLPLLPWMPVHLQMCGGGKFNGCF